MKTRIIDNLFTWCNLSK